MTTPRRPAVRVRLRVRTRLFLAALCLLTLYVLCGLGRVPLALGLVVLGLLLALCWGLPRLGYGEGA